MNRQTCEWIEDLMVEFSDGELPESQNALVEEHVTSCPSCRHKTFLLEKSLHQAKMIWREATDGVEPGCGGAKRKRRIMPIAATVAAVAVVVLASALGTWMLRSSTPTSPSLPQNGIATTSDSFSPKVSTLALSDIDAILKEEARAARLAASAELLSTVPSLDHFTHQAEEYLAVNYPQSRAGKQTRERLRRTNTPLKKDPKQ